MPISDRLGGMSLQRLPPDQALDKTDETLTPEKSYSRQLLAEGWHKWKEHWGVKVVASTLAAIVIPWLKTGIFWRTFWDTGVWVIATFFLSMILHTCWSCSVLPLLW